MTYLKSRFELKKIRLRVPTARETADYAIITAGTALSAAAMTVFIRPAQIPVGGVTGIALILNYLFDLPLGIMNLALNLPLFWLGFRKLGGGFFVRTVYATAAYSVFLDLFAKLLPVYDGEMLLSVLYGGVLSGAAMGLLLMRGATMGGIDIIGKIVAKKTGTSIGTFSMIVSGAIIVGAAIVYGRIESAMYALVLQFVYARVMDGIIFGADESLAIFIVTACPSDISSRIMERMHRGVTAVEGTGMFTGKQRSVLMCAVKRHEANTVKLIVKETDPEAFVMFANAREVYGKGFKTYD